MKHKFNIVSILCEKLEWLHPTVGNVTQLNRQIVPAFVCIAGANWEFYATGYNSGSLHCIWNVPTFP